MVEDKQFAGKEFLDFDVLYALEYFKNQRESESHNEPILSSKAISAFFDELSSVNKARKFSLSIAVYKNLNRAVLAEEVTIKQSGTSYNFRNDKSKNVFLRIPAGNQSVNSLVLMSTLAGLAIGVFVILYAVFKNIKK